MNRYGVVISVIYFVKIICRCCHQALLRMDKLIPREERVTRVERTIAEVQDTNLCVILWKIEGDDQQTNLLLVRPNKQLTN